MSDDLRNAALRAAPAGQLDASEQSRSEQVLRRLLAYRCSGKLLYADDGELQDNSMLPWIDFKRDSVDSIETKLGERDRASAKPTSPDQWIYDLAAEYELPGGGLFGPLTFSATSIIDFARAFEAELAIRSRAKGGHGGTGGKA